MVKWRKAQKKQVTIEFREVNPNTVLINRIQAPAEQFVEVVNTGHGLAKAFPDKDFIIKDECGEYPIRKDIFEKTYDVITPVDLLVSYEPEIVQDKSGVCIFCGKSEHKDLEKMEQSQLFDELSRMMNQPIIAITLNEFHDQQWNISRMGCVLFEMRRRDKNEQI